MKASLKERLRAEANRLQKESDSRGNFTKVEWFKPETGKNLIRILPIKGLEDPYKAIRQHLISIRKKDGAMAHNIPVRCGRDLKKTRDAKQGDCLLCDGYEKLVKVDKDKAKALRPQDKFLYLVFDFNTKKVMPYSAPSTVHSEIIGFAADMSDEDDNPFDLKAGRNWSLTKKVDPSKGKIFGTSYQVRPGSSASEFPEKLHGLIAEATDMSSIFEDYDVEKIKMFLSSLRLDTASDDDEDLVKADDDEEDFSKAKAKAKAASVKAKSSSRVQMPDESEEEFLAADGDEEDEEVKPKRRKVAPKDDFDFEAELAEAGL